VPYYNKPTQEGLFRHFEAIARSTTLPCILYNVPSRTVTDMAAETTLRLSHIPNIVGIKEASGNLAQITNIIRGARSDFHVWSGNDEDTLPVLAVGGYGVVSVASHLVGSQIQEMIQSFILGSNEKAAAIHGRLLPLVKALFLVGNPVPLKYALNHVGFNVGNPRLPLVEPDEAIAAKIREALSAQRVDLAVAV